MHKINSNVFLIIDKMPIPCGQLKDKLAKLTMLKRNHNPKGNYKISVGQHWPPINAKVGSGATEE
jgi:hypothetical protein